MKKFVIISLCVAIMMIAGCNEIQNDGDENMNVEFQTGIYHDKDWNEPIGTYQEDVIPSKEVALKVAVQIFEGMQKSSSAQKYVPQSVFFDEQDEVWIVSFWEQTDEMVAGADCSIALQKADGKVLRIWFGE